MKLISLFLGFCTGVLLLAAAYRIANIDTRPKAVAVEPPICVEFIPPCTTDSDCEERGISQP